MVKRPNATTGNVTLTSTTVADGHTIYDVKLNDKVTLGTGANAVTIDGTAGKATVGTAVVDGVNNTITTGGANAVKLDGAQRYCENWYCNRNWWYFKRYYRLV